MRVVFFACAIFALPLLAENLVPGGDFTAAKQNLRPIVNADIGKVSLFQEELNWNKCGCLEMGAPYTNKAGYTVYNAFARVGCDAGGLPGFEVKPGRTYDYSFEVRGTVKSAGMSVTTWNKGLWEDGKNAKVTLCQYPVSDKWTLYKGSFKVSEGNARATLNLQMWSSTQYPPLTVKTGDRLYFDNVVVKESPENLSMLEAGAKGGVKIAPVKTVADGVEISDFILYKHIRRPKSSLLKAGSPAVNPPRVLVSFGANSVLAKISLEDEKGVVAGNVKSPWSGETAELFFGPVPGKSDREYTQIAWNPAGAKFANGCRAEEWTLISNEIKGNVWTSVAEIPYAVLGFDRPVKKGEVLAFNAAFTRKGVGDMLTWAPVPDSFGSFGKVGRIVFGTYSQGLETGFGAKASVVDRAEYEIRVSELEAAARQAEIDRFIEKGFTVSVVPVDSDWTIPFVPKQAFHPPTNIVIRTAVNGRIGLPVAILNMTDKTESYVVRIETDTFDPKRAYAEKQHNGAWGLKNFPPDRMVAREALRFKDSDAEPTVLRYEQLAKMNEACVVQVPPKEAGLAWFDFNTDGVAPGLYKGRLRVIPLGLPSEWKPSPGYHQRMYKGKMQDIPVKLEVLPIVLDKEPAQPNGFFQDADQKSMFDLMYDIGTRDFLVSPWSFVWGRTEDRGHLDYSKPGKDILKTKDNIMRLVKWAGERGGRITYFIGFSAYNTFCSLYGYRKDQVEESLPLWVEYLRGVKKCMNSWGIPDNDYAVEVFDEPSPKIVPDIIKILKASKRELPTVRLVMTLGAHLPTIEMVRRMDPFVDSWVMWSFGYFGKEDGRRFKDEALAAGKEIWHYTCSESGRAPIYPTYHMHPWFGYCHGLTGNQFFIFQNQSGGSGSSDFKVAMTSGIAYRSFETTMPSLRYMSMRRGVEDVKYLAKLKAIAGDLPEVKKFLEQAPKKVVEKERHDPTCADRMRERAIELILKYSKQIRKQSDD